METLTLVKIVAAGLFLIALGYAVNNIIVCIVQFKKDQEDFKDYLRRDGILNQLYEEGILCKIH